MLPWKRWYHVLSMVDWTIVIFIYKSLEIQSSVEELGQSEEVICRIGSQLHLTIVFVCWIHMQVDLNQFIKSALYYLDVDKLTLTIPFLCKKLSVTPHVAKLYFFEWVIVTSRILMEIDKEKADQVASILCILGTKKGVYTASVCKKEELESSHLQSLFISI